MVGVVGGGSFSTLTRKNGIKVGAGSPCSVEEVCLAVGEIIGHGNIKSAARMNGAVVLFVEKVEHAQQVVEKGVSVNGLFLQVSPLTLPSTKIMLSNVPPFISDEFLIKELSRHGKVVSPVKKVLSGCKSPLLKHVVSHRRQLFMILNRKDEEMNLRFHVRVDDFDYVLFATSGQMKCFGCGQEGHIIKMCPDKAELAKPDSEKQQPVAAEQGKKQIVRRMLWRETLLMLRRENPPLLPLLLLARLPLRGNQRW
uniref:YTX1 n=1 Tax=Poeciliopsis prolifica TaxID=188132 RepID=A0A0S7EY72_9TELE